MSTIQTVKTQIQSLIDLANETTGNQDTNLTDGVNALVGGYGQGGSGGSLEGLENGYDVTFCDSDKNVIAFTSVKQGISVNPPVCGVENWTDSLDSTISFPFTPTEDITFYAQVVSVVAQIYEHFNMDITEYPYVLLSPRTYNGSNFVVVTFGTTEPVISTYYVELKDGIKRQTCYANKTLTSGDGLLDNLLEAILGTVPNLTAYDSYAGCHYGYEGWLENFVNIENTVYDTVRSIS